MPVLAIIPIISGVSAMAAAGGIAAGFTLATVSAGAMMLGGALSLVGGITGNKTLSKVGGFVSLAGGLGSIANSFATAGSSAAGSSSTAATDAGLSVDNVVGTTASDTFGEALAGTAGKTITGTAAELGGVGQNIAGLDIGAQLGDTGALLGGTASNIAADAGVSLGNSAIDLGSNLGGGNILTTLNDKLGKYDKIMELAGGLAKGYDSEQKRRDALKFNNDRIALGARDRALNEKKFNTADANANANFSVNLGSNPQNSGMLYNGITQRRLPTRSVI